MGVVTGDYGGYDAAKEERGAHKTRCIFRVSHRFLNFVQHKNTQDWRERLAYKDLPCNDSERIRPEDKSAQKDLKNVNRNRTHTPTRNPNNKKMIKKSSLSRTVIPSSARRSRPNNAMNSSDIDFFTFDPANAARRWLD